MELNKNVWDNSIGEYDSTRNFLAAANTNAGAEQGNEDDDLEDEDLDDDLLEDEDDETEYDAGEGSDGGSEADGGAA